MLLPPFFQSAANLPVVSATQGREPVRAPAGYALVYNFLGSPDAAQPVGRLYSNASALYGTSYSGGSNPGGYGTVFRLRRAGGVFRDSILYNFTAGSDGANPTSGIVASPSGALYGTTQGAGPSNNGTVFELVPAGNGYQETTIDGFTQRYDGSIPSGVILDSSGRLFGVTQDGGLNGDGIVYELAPSGSAFVETILYNFAGGLDGKGPTAGLVADASGALYGTTYGGGKYGAGTVFKLTPTGSGFVYSLVYTFQGTYDGSAPSAAMVVAKNGVLYGTTYYGGGPFYYGTVFALKPEANGYKERVIYSFLGGTDGLNPATSVTLGPHEQLYGTTAKGGTYGDGVVFALTPNGGGQYTESVLHAFQGYPADGQGASTPLLIEKGTLFGATEGGGVCCGALFEFTP